MKQKQQCLAGRVASESGIECIHLDKGCINIEVKLKARL